MRRPTAQLRQCSWLGTLGLILWLVGLVSQGTTSAQTSLAETRQRADQGDAYAQYNLGLMYATGQGVTQDFTQAAAWYCKAADQGDAYAQYNLGLMYAAGQGVAVLGRPCSSISTS